MNSFCPNFKQVLLAENPDKTKLLLLRARCKQWSCAYCAPMNQTLWRKHLNERIGALGGAWSFMTLTAHSAAHDGGWTLLNLRDAYKPIYDSIRYNFGAQKPIDYVRIFEQHKSLEFHIHMLWRLNLDPFTEMNKWLKDLVTRNGLGWRCEWVAARDNENPSGITRYITKYMTKSAQGGMDMPKGIRRIQTSQGIGALKPEKAKENWHRSTGVYKAELKFYEQVIDVNTGHIVTASDFKGWSVYPKQLDIDYDS